ncbi:hypothetical protein BDZ91DRAFT_509801 [Kalaharituber pfeilii]|nr:hypothetical protein BDZ91DRAFT_509801 [Kalaharituber pfeilii]
MTGLVDVNTGKTVDTEGDSGHIDRTSVYSGATAVLEDDNDNNDSSRSESSSSEISDSSTEDEEPHDEHIPAPSESTQPNTSISGPECWEGLQQCLQCASENIPDLCWCVNCDSTFCRKCWDEQLVHRKNKKQDGAVHTKLSLEEAVVLDSLRRSDQNTTNSHEIALKSKWFGVTIDSNSSNVKFDITGRYLELSMTNTALNQQKNFPALVSFVGETGAGKSSLINGLVKITSGGKHDFETPVVGEAEHAHLPTSSDVHVFIDPKSRGSERPIIYADCEGLHGGNQAPQAIIQIQEAKKQYRKRGLRAQGRRLRSLRIANLRREQRCRGWVVTEFYPKILFTLSEVVCYVTRNLRTFEVIIEKLLTWAEGAIESSVNQVLPIALIVVNSLELDEQSGDWYEPSVTETLMANYNDLSQNPQLRSLAERWKQLREKPVSTLQELVQCYYTDIKVVCIPHHKIAPGQLVLKQYESLYKEITEATKRTRVVRANSGHLWNWNDLGRYIDYVFNHFSQNPTDIPFNFLDAAFVYNPVHSHFHIHIQRAGIRLKRFKGEGTYDVFKTLVPLIGSSILLDTRRQSLPRNDARKVVAGYEPHLRQAYKAFYDEHWPCDFRHTKGRCVNVRKKHQKGHQLENGKIIAGGYIEAESNQNIGENLFVEEVRKYVEEHLKKIKSRSEAALYRRKLFKDDPSLNMLDFECPSTICARERSFMRGRPRSALGVLMPSQRLITSSLETSNTLSPGCFTAPSGPFMHLTCFGCLFSIPQQLLTCGHLLCNDCVDDYGEKESIESHKLTGNPRFNILLCCPFCIHQDATQAKCTWIITREPIQAAPRVLSLDGGGIRAILQLKTLSLLQTRIDLGLPIHQFFDLIIGTSAGGIVALALGHNHRSIEECIQLFNKLSEQAFTKRVGAGIPGLRWLVEAHHHSQFRSSGLKNAFKTALGERRMFGDGETSPANVGNKEIKVGVTLTASSGYPYLVTSYNREDFKNTEVLRPIERSNTGTVMSNKYYGFLRGESKETELKTWEAALATTAAPRYFKPFRHKMTGNVFMDGGLNFNNPIAVADKERQLLWPTRLYDYPDILLSLGTGYTDDALENLEKNAQAGAARLGAWGHFRRLRLIIGWQTRHQLNSHRIWTEYMDSLAQSPNQTVVSKQKYQRLDIKFDHEVPKLDKVEEFTKLDTQIVKHFEDPSNQKQLQLIAAQLVASLFYFCEDRTDPSTQNSSFVVHGHIFCRLDPGSTALKRLCQKLRTYATTSDTSSAIFMFSHHKFSNDKEPLVPLGSSEPIPIGIEPFKFQVQFNVPSLKKPFRIHLSSPWSSGILNDGNASQLPFISGFPCSLQTIRRRNSPDKRTNTPLS